jgi:hypothetical protein
MQSLNLLDLMHVYCLLSHLPRFLEGQRENKLLRHSQSHP